MSLDDLNRRRRIRAQLARLQRAVGIESGPSKVGSLRQRIAWIEKRVKCLQKQVGVGDGNREK